MLMSKDRMGLKINGLTHPSVLTHAIARRNGQAYNPTIQVCKHCEAVKYPGSDVWLKHVSTWRKPVIYVACPACQ
jgi:hypothetical protein